jgi:hypothetical protein
MCQMGSDAMVVAGETFTVSKLLKKILIDFL